MKKFSNYVIACAWAVSLLCGTVAKPTWAAEVNFVSTQLRPVDEADKVRNVILKGMSDTVKFTPEDDGPFLTRLLAEVAAGKGQVGVAGALDSSLATLNDKGALSDLDALYASLAKTRSFNSAFTSVGTFGGERQRMVPWMYSSYIMMANKKALPYLPKGADINALTYDQLKQWAKAIKDATGEAKLGFPAGPKGLMHRFFQGYLYPSYTGGMARTFRSVDAQKMWADFRDLWQYTNARSTAYGFMEEPMASGEVWIAFDHAARLLPALKEKPGDFVAFPAPAGPRGRGYMLVLAGLSIPKSAPDKEAAGRLIDHLTRSTTQAITLAETGFYPVVKTTEVKLGEGIAMVANALEQQSGAKDARAATVPVGLGAKGGEFNKIYLDAFQRIVLRREDIAGVLKAQGEAMKALLDEVKIPCWAPDKTQGTHCSVD
ncbi:ABC transporter substrate-binding protein [Rhodoferax sp.]|uniref:ABC transporter substrate-binding protein n=1 Tax=Rhodoferax sp. TaxID=50421 RepID=UPI0025F03425|nr:ABC transporter substrate-binding protein [Rhodoferax sp.]